MPTLKSIRKNASNKLDDIEYDSIAVFHAKIAEARGWQDASAFIMSKAKDAFAENLNELAKTLRSISNEMKAKAELMDQQARKEYDS